MSVVYRQPGKASQNTYDLIVVGGGIYGVMLILEAARCGLRPLLIERNDFGSATSFNSLRIVHGGLRYLQDLDLQRFRESVQERRWFLQNFPDLVRPLPCLMPLYGEGLRKPGMFRAALWLNDLLSYRRNQGVRPDRWLSPGRVINRQETYRLFPGIDKAGLQGGAIWYDACMPDSQRLLIEALRWSCSLGATALNYIEATQLIRPRERVRGILAIDRESGQVHEYRANVVVNATGPWSRLTAQCFDRDEEALFRGSIAWNILLNQPALSDHALALTPKKPDAQTYFLHPWKGKILAGTGHAPWKRGPDNPQPSAELVETFLQDINDTVPRLHLCNKDIIRVLAGLLPAKDCTGTTLTVREVIIDHGRNGGPQGLYSISGVKFTTSRRVAEKVLQRIFSGSRWSPAREKYRTSFRPDPQDGWDLQATDVLESRKDDWKEDLRRVIAQESVVHLDDLVLRRTTLWEDPGSALLLAPQLCALFDWGGARCIEETVRLKRNLGFEAHGIAIQVDSENPTLDIIANKKHHESFKKHGS